MALKILFEDDNLIVIYKPAGIATQTKKAYEKDVVSELKKHLKGGYVGVVHRLDQPVEGLLVFAKNQKAAAALSKQVQQKGEDVFVKDYVAACYCEEQIEKNRTIDLQDYLLKTAEGKAVIIDENNLGKNSEAKLSKLSFEIIASKEKIYILRIHLQTGRFHQIRAQLSNAGLPILGDRKYGTDKSLELSDELRLRQVLLCADRLSFTHPVTNEAMSFAVEPDEILGLI